MASDRAAGTPALKFLSTKGIRLFLVALLLCVFAIWGETADRSIFNEIGQDLQELHQITGLKIHHKVPYDLISKNQVNQFLKDRVEEESSQEDLRIEELGLKKFGFVPQDFDLKKNEVDLLTEQAAAFYDYHKKKLYITDWAPKDMREEALIHELAHALADQNFHLERFIKKGDDDDQEMAREAVMEGQATWLMSEAVERRSGHTLEGSPKAVEEMSHSMESEDQDYPVYDSTPLYLRRTLVFPYTQGMLFQNAVVENDGDAAFAEVFRHPPVSTQQILHPEKYFADAKPTRPALPRLPDRHGYKQLAWGTMGELDHALLIEQYVDKKRAADIAPHWRGGVYALEENKKQKRVVLEYAVEWENADWARRYFADYQKVLRKKWKKIEVQSQSDSQFAGLGDDGYFVVRLEGAVVSSLEGLRDAAVDSN